MAAAVIADSDADIFRNFVQTLEKLIDRKRLQIGMPIESLVQVRYIGVVVLVMMNFHGHLIDIGLQRIGGVWERGKNVGQRTLLL
jgi:hypothetical protein